MSTTYRHQSTSRRAFPAVVIGVLGLAASGVLAASYTLPASSAWDTTNASVTSTTLAATGTVADRNYNVFDNYTTTIGLPIGNATNAEYVDLLILNGSNITSSSVMIGDNANSLGHFTVVVDSATLNANGTANSNIRLGSKSSNNSLYVQNGGKLDVTGSAFNGNGNDGYVNNNIVVNGAGSQINSTFDFYTVYGNGTGGLTVENGGHLTVGTATDTTNRRLRVRFGHDTTIAVTGAGSKIDAYGTMNLGESATYSENNKLVLEDEGSVWVHNVTNSSPVFSAALKSGGVAHQIDLGGGYFVVKGNQVANTAITNLIYADNGSGYTAGVKGTATWDGSAWDLVSSGSPGNYYAFYVDGTAGQSYLVGGVETAGYTVFMNVVPEPASLALLGLGGLLTMRRRRA